MRIQFASLFLVTLTATFLPFSAYAEKVVCFVSGSSQPFQLAMQQGASEKSAELGIQFRSYGPSNTPDNQAEIKAVEQCVMEGADAILVAPSMTSSPPLVTSAALQARSGGSVVIAMESDLPSAAADAIIASSPYAAGFKLGRWADAKLGTDVRAGFLNINEGSHQWLGFVHGLQSDGDDADNATNRITSNAFVGWTQEQAFDGTLELFRADREINLIFTATDTVAAGAQEALAEMGLTDDVLIAVADTSCTGVESVQNGTFHAAAQHDPFRLGRLGVQAAFNLLSGNSISQQGKDECGGEDQAPTDPCCNDPDSCMPNYFRSNANLIANEPIGTIPSILPDEARAMCWQ